jgi:hypothetical protein
MHNRKTHLPPSLIVNQFLTLIHNAYAHFFWLASSLIKHKIDEAADKQQERNKRIIS